MRDKAHKELEDKNEDLEDKNMKLYYKSLEGKIKDLEDKNKNLDGKNKDLEAEVERAVKLLNASAKTNEELLDFKNDLLKTITCGICKKLPRGSKDVRCICSHCKYHYVCVRCNPNDCQKANRDLSAHRIKLQDPEKHQIDAICSKLEFPCQFSKSGCGIQAKLISLENHETECEYRDVNCFWNGCVRPIIPLRQLEEHLVSAHKMTFKIRSHEMLSLFKITDGPPAQGIQYIKLSDDDTVLIFPRLGKLDNVTLTIRQPPDTLYSSRIYYYFLMVSHIEKFPATAKGEIWVQGKKGQVRHDLKLFPFEIISTKRAIQEGYAKVFSKQYIEKNFGLPHRVWFSLRK